MRTRGGSRAAFVAAAGLLAVALAACDGGSSGGAVTSLGSGSDSSGSGSSGPSTSGTEAPDSSAAGRTAGTSTSGSASAPTSGSASTLSADEVQAKIVAGAPPKDLTWLHPKTPSSWQKLKTDGAGTLQWRVEDTCVVTLDQPAGLGTKRTPTSEQVLEHTAEQTASALSASAPKYHDRKTRMVPNVIVGFNGSAKVQMAQSLVDYGKARSRIVAYRKGDFALTAQSICGDAKTFSSASKSEIDPFIDKLQARTRY
ncbi:hypothetical protein [Flexivirga sp. B27]